MKILHQNALFLYQIFKNFPEPTACPSAPYSHFLDPPLVDELYKFAHIRIILLHVTVKITSTLTIQHRCIDLLFRPQSINYL